MHSSQNSSIECFFLLNCRFTPLELQDVPYKIHLKNIDKLSKYSLHDFVVGSQVLAVPVPKEPKDPKEPVPRVRQAKDPLEIQQSKSFSFDTKSKSIQARPSETGWFPLFLFVSIMILGPCCVYESPIPRACGKAKPCEAKHQQALSEVATVAVYFKVPGVSGTKESESHWVSHNLLLHSLMFSGEHFWQSTDWVNSTFFPMHTKDSFASQMEL